jgi:hypothetical protein
MAASWSFGILKSARDAPIAATTLTSGSLPRGLSMGWESM